MSTGVFGSGGIVEFAAALYGTDDDPMDEVIMRDGVHHGLHHAADSMGQIRVNYMPIGADVVEAQATFATIDTPANTSDWYLMGASPFGTWPLTVRADGSAYKLRIRLAGASSSATGTVVFRVVIHPSATLTDADIAESLDSIFEVTVADSAAIAWRAGTSQGSIGSATLLTVSAAQVREWIREVSVFDAVSSPAAGREIQQCLVSAHVFAKTTDVTKFPRLHGLHLQGFVG